MAEEKDSSAVRKVMQSSGLAGATARVFIDSSLAPILFVLLLLLGAVSLFFVQYQEEPHISIPVIDVIVEYPGAAADEVSSLVTGRLEHALHEIPGIRDISSSSGQGRALLRVQFNPGLEVDESVSKVREKLSSSMDRLPPEVMPPLVKAVDTTDVPAMVLTLWSEGLDDGILRSLGLELLQRLEKISGAGKGLVIGGRQEQLRVEVSPELLADFGIRLDQVAQAIRSATVGENNSIYGSGRNTVSARTGAFLDSVRELERLPVANWQAAPVSISDVARVSPGPSASDQAAGYFSGAAREGDTVEANGAAAVTLLLTRKQNASGVPMTGAILERIEALKNVDTGIIPANVHVTVSRDYSTAAKNTVPGLVWSLLKVAFAVALVCLAGLGLRAGSAVIATIPLVIMLMVWWMNIMDYTIDRVSLCALIFALGILASNATIVVDNIIRRWSAQGNNSLAVAIDAIREVSNPNLLASLAMMAACLPMVWFDGLLGQYMRAIPVLGAAAMVFSLLAALIFTPWVMVRLTPDRVAINNTARPETRWHEGLHHYHRSFVLGLVSHRKTGLVFLSGMIVIPVAISTILYLQQERVELLPFENRNEFSVLVNMPDGAAVPDREKVTRAMAGVLRQIPEVTAVQVFAGRTQPLDDIGLITRFYLPQRALERVLLVSLTDKNKRIRNHQEIILAAREVISPIAEQTGARIAFSVAPPGPPLLSTMAVRTPVPEANGMNVPGKLDQIDAQRVKLSGNLRFEIDTEQSERLAVSGGRILEILTMAMGGYRSALIERGPDQEPVDIIIQVPLSVRSQASRLGNLLIPTADGKTVPLSSLGSFVSVQEHAGVDSVGLQGMEYVEDDTQKRTGTSIRDMPADKRPLKEQISPLVPHLQTAAPSRFEMSAEDTGLSINWPGERTLTDETFKALFGVLIAAMILIYGLMAWGFRSFMLAGLVMLPIPVIMIGTLPGHWVMAAEFTAMSMTGVILLGGFMVRQSILMVTFVKRGLGKGMDLNEAALSSAGYLLRPILMTTLTLMVAAFALLADPIFTGMGISLFFGAGVATLMAFVMIPVGCIIAGEPYFVDKTGDGVTEGRPVFGTAGETREGMASVIPDRPRFRHIRDRICTTAAGLNDTFRDVFQRLVAGFMRGRQDDRKTMPPPPAAYRGDRTPPPPWKASSTVDTPRHKTSATGVAPPPYKRPASKAAPIPRREEPVTGVAPPIPAPAAADAKTDARDIQTGHDETDDANGIGKKRRGIRLKQDLF